MSWLVWTIQAKFGRYTFVVFGLWFDATIHPYLGNNINERFDIQQRESEHQMVGVEAALLPEAVPLLIYVVVHGLIFLPPSPVNSSI